MPGDPLQKNEFEKGARFSPAGCHFEVAPP
jgi:hypothetical protein